jgi:hypothetical protein
MAPPAPTTPVDLKLHKRLHTDRILELVQVPRLQKPRFAALLQRAL